MNQQKATRSYSGWGFLTITLLGIAGVYADFMRVYYPLAMDPYDFRRGNARVSLLLFNVLVFLQLWSLLQVLLSDPGHVPPFWGFSMEDSNTARRRYCLMCHVFKPQRCHHCSVCNRCILQMDHHCPWVNQCIGFYNRKFFLLLLWYTLVLIFLDIILMSSRASQSCQRLFSGEHGLEMPANLYSIGLFTFLCALAIVLLNFFRLHISLVLGNRTTIEHIEQMRTGDVFNEFDKGHWQNWKQVFGGNPLIWLLPMYGSCGRPCGDGVRWSALEINVDLPTMESPNTLASPQHLLLSSSQRLSPGRQVQRPENAGAKSVVLETTFQPEESDLRDLSKALGSNSSVLSHSFKCEPIVISYQPLLR